MSHQEEKTPLQLLKANWVIIVFVFGSFAAWVTLTNKVESHAQEIKALQLVDNATMSSNNQILVELSGIRADLIWLKNNLNK